MRSPSPHLLIQKAFKKRQKDQNQLSLRGLAKKMKISPGYLSKIMKGQKSLNPRLISSLSQQLKMDALQHTQLLESFENKILKEKVGDIKSPKIVSKMNPQLEQFELAPENTEWILSKWYYTAVLDLITTQDFDETPAAIAKRLQILSSEAQEALEALKKMNLIRRNETGKLEKIHQHIRFPTRISKDIIRQYHISQMKRSMRLLEHRHSQIDFDSRLIVGLTLAANKESFEKVKLFLHKALYEAAEMLAAGDCTELYQMNLQLFPQTVQKK